MDCFNAMNKRELQFLRRWGMLRWLYSGLLRVLARVSDFTLCHIFIRPIYPQSSDKQVNSRFSFRLLTADEIHLHADNPALEIDHDFIARALALGDNCSGAFDKDKLIAYSWRAYSATPHTDDIFINFASRYRYGYKAFTLPEYRGQQILQQLHRYTDYLTRNGRQQQLSCINTHNFPSIHYIHNCGGKTSGMAGYLSLFGKTFFFRSPTAKRIGFYFSKA